MKTRTLFPAIAALFAAVGLPAEMLAQSADVKTPNKNESAKFKSAIFKGSGNRIQSNSIASFIGGGQSNIVFLGVTNAVIGGGFANFVTGAFGTVGGGLANTNSGFAATVGGGEENTAKTNFATIGGGLANTNSGYSSTIAGGEHNTVSEELATIGGGLRNTNSAISATIAGGEDNTASGERATIGGGALNMASNSYAVVSGGYRNIASGSNSVAAGGTGNLSSGEGSVVGGGDANRATARYSTVPGGYLGTATNVGAFVWSGGPITGFGTFSTNDFSFTVRAVGGVRFITTDVESRTVPIGPYDTPTFTNGVYLAPNSGAWASLSDSNAKTKITAIKPREILSKVAAMPVTQWEYKSDPDMRRYIGPMAQDFHAAFGLGYDDKTISTLDSDGVMYAAIQGLVEELKERDKAIDKLETELRALREEVRGKLPPAP